MGTLYMEIICEGEDYNTYNVPLLLNGEAYNLRVVYSYTDEAYHIPGARQGLDASMGDKNLIQLQPGDEVTTMLYTASCTGNDSFALTEWDSLTVTEDTAFAETELGDGLFSMMFELVDARNRTACSEEACFSAEGGEIYLLL